MKPCLTKNRRLLIFYSATGIAASIVSLIEMLVYGYQPEPEAIPLILAALTGGAVLGAIMCTEDETDG